jgi:hypothetical protein
VLHDIPGGTQADYDAITQAMGRDAGLNSLSDWPAEGILCHIAGPYDGAWRVVDVWDRYALLDVLYAVMKAKDRVTRQRT